MDADTATPQPRFKTAAESEPEVADGDAFQDENQGGCSAESEDEHSASDDDAAEGDDWEDPVEEQDTIDM